MRVGPWSKGILRDVARRVLPWSIAHRPKIYGMAFDARTWIEEAANPAFLTHGLLRDTLEIPQDEFNNVIAAGNHVVRVRLWSAEVWVPLIVCGPLDPANRTGPMAVRDGVRTALSPCGRPGQLNLRGRRSPYQLSVVVLGRRARLLATPGDR